MDSFDGSRRRDPRAAMPPSERRSHRQPQPLDQRLDRWMSTGRQLVEGVSGGRPGARGGSRRPEGRAGNRGGFDGLGRWVEDRLDWLLDDSDDWPEPWQESDRRAGDPEPRRPVSISPAADRPPLASKWPGASEQPRRRLEAISRRSRTDQPAAPAVASLGGESPDGQDWPDDSVFNVPRWQRPAPPLRRPDPLQLELERRDPPPADGLEARPATASRPLPRSSRRR